MIKQRNQSRQVLFYTFCISNTHLYTLVCRFHVNKEVYMGNLTCSRHATYLHTIYVKSREIHILSTTFCI
jgi:hypothetical protein